MSNAKLSFLMIVLGSTALAMGVVRLEPAQQSELAPAATQASQVPRMTRSELLRLPLSMQKSVYAELPAELKAEFWKEKLEDAVRSYDGLSPQFGILVELRSMASADLFAEDQGAVPIELDQLSLEAESSFAHDELYCIAYTLEDVEECHRRIETSNGPGLAPEEDGDRDEGNLLTTCNCRGGSDCHHVLVCGSGMCARVLGCGIFGVFWCTGFCTVPF